jgi:hypothetical protein
MSSTKPPLRSRRRSEIQTRLRSATDVAERCRIVGCRQPTTAAVARGLNRNYCRRHEDQHARHGSYFKRSYSALQLNPYRRAATGWVVSSNALPGVLGALEGIRGLYRSAGPAEPAFRLAGKKPEQRARVALARLREAKIAPELVLSAWLAVQAIHLDDPQPERRAEFRLVQVAKIVHRLASGTHKRWEQTAANGSMKVVKLDKYPQSRGEVLRRLGRMIDHVADSLSQSELDAAMASIREQARSNPSARAHPRAMARKRIA